MDLPFEVQFKFLLDLPYDDIVAYCQTNSQAALICDTEAFWNEKLREEYDIPLEAIIGPSPIQKYQIASMIMGSDDPLLTAIELGQLGLVRAFWISEDVYDLESELILKLLNEKQPEMVELLMELTENSREREYLVEDIAEEAYWIALNNGYFHLLKHFSPYFDISYVWALVEIVDNFGDHIEGIDLIIEDALEHHSPEIIQKFASWLLHQGDYLLLDHLLEKYPQYIDKKKLAQQAIEDV